MGSLYQYGIDVSDKKNISNVEASFRYILENSLNDKNDVLYLDFEITCVDNYIKVIGKNAPSALWLSGILINNASELIKNDTFVISDRKYHFNSKTNKLTYSILHE
jgi:hypothetical protein